ncbi:MAG: hypothetical protein ACP5T9_06245 [Thermoplasmata archaeon]
MYIVKILGESYGKLHDPRPPWDRIEILGYKFHSVESMYDDLYFGLEQFAFPSAKQATDALRAMLWKEYKSAIFSYFENIEHLGVPDKPEYFNILFKHITREDKEKLKKHGLHPVSGFKITRTSLKEYLNKVLLSDKRGNFRYANAIRPVTYFLVFRSNSKYYKTKERNVRGRPHLFFEKNDTVDLPDGHNSIHLNDKAEDIFAKFVISLIGIDTVLNDLCGSSVDLAKRVVIFNAYFSAFDDKDVKESIHKYAEKKLMLNFVLRETLCKALNYVRNYLKKQGIIPSDYKAPDS